MAYLRITSETSCKHVEIFQENTDASLTRALTDFSSPLTMAIESSWTQTLYILYRKPPWIQDSSFHARKYLSPHSFPSQTQKYNPVL